MQLRVTQLSLQQRTEAPDMNAIISARILAALAETGCIIKAYDSVMGEGAYHKLAGDIWSTLRTRTQ
jgi:UDP-glucose 6-dehydrogenase